ncbi:CatB-related O-acetyltransferase [Agrobacterium rosae]|uniref:CatB-related O-acetyltransferase n=1 Tax=Agrobacterium rosae TaxID=1972867 RepID=UPI003A7FFFF3
MFFKRKKRKEDNNNPTTKISQSSRVSKDSIIGKYCYVGERCDITKSEIGNYVSIANNVSIGPGEHCLNKISTNSLFYETPYLNLTQGHCKIESDVWIGVDSIIRRGVTVGIGAVVGANSFVNSDVPDFAIVAGSPARIIGYRFNPACQKLILDSEWWNLDIDDAKATQDKLYEVITKQS